MGNVEPTREQLQQEVTDLRRQLVELTAGQESQSQAAEKLWGSRDRLSELIESTGHWLWEVDRDGVYTYVSSRSRDILGREPDDLIGTMAFDIMPPAEAERVAAIFHDFGSRAEPFECIENTCLHADGREIVMETSGVPVYGPDGNLKGYRGIDRDITDRKRAEEELTAAVSFLDTIVDMSPFAMWVATPDGTIIRANQSLYETLNVTSEQLLGKYNVLTDTNIKKHGFMHSVTNVFEKHKPVRFVLPWKAAEAGDVAFEGVRDVYIDVSMFPILNVEGELLYVVAQWVDITEQTRLEEQLRQAQKMDAIGQLAGGVAHDFNNILTAVQGNAELLKMSLPDGKQALFVDEIIRSANRAADLTKQLLAFARKGKWQVAPVDIHNIIVQTVTMLTHSIDRRIEIQMELQASPGIVMGDPTQLQNALLNLGVNARDAMPEGGVLTYATRNVTLSQTDCNGYPYDVMPGDFLEIRIADTGIGIDAQTQKRIFEPFFTTKEVGKGTGLGLAGVYGCVKNHYGSIRVYSELDQGTTFAILLPHAAAHTHTSAPTGSSESPIRGTGHILVVDDEESVRNFVMTFLQNLGYSVSMSFDGVAGLDYYREHYQDIDLVILDLIMPRMNGLDVFKEMKQINPNVRVVVSSGFSHTQAKRQMLDCGALGVLTKPFHSIELSKIVAKNIHHD